MAYEYTLTNEGQFKADEFQEAMPDIQLKNDGLVECNEIIESLEFKSYGTSTYLKIFYHRPSSSTDYWEGYDLLNNSYLDFNKFSLINILDDSFKIDGEFTFRLEFPSGTLEGTDIGASDTWKQSSNPKNEPISGYESLNGKFTGKNGWGGLAPSSASGSTLIDGSPNSNDWFYPIGQKNEWNGGIPGFLNDHAFRDIKLWVKLPESKLKEKGSFYFGADDNIYCNEFIEE